MLSFGALIFLTGNRNVHWRTVRANFSSASFVQKYFIQYCFARLTSPSNISLKSLDFGHFLLDGLNNIFRLINTRKKYSFFSFLAAGCCRKNLAIAKKLLARLGQQNPIWHCCDCSTIWLHLVS